MDIKYPHDPPSKQEDYYKQGSEKGPAPNSYTLARTAPPSTFRTTFACISLHMSDRIRLLRFTSADTRQIKEIIHHAWPQGIQDTRAYDASDEIKLYGYPWNPTGWGNSKRIDSRRLICRLLAGLFNMGWMLNASVDISQKEFDKGKQKRTSTKVTHTQNHIFVIIYI